MHSPHTHTHLHEAPGEQLAQGDAQQQRAHLISHLLWLLTHLRGVCVCVCVCVLVCVCMRTCMSLTDQAGI